MDTRLSSAIVIGVVLWALPRPLADAQAASAANESGLPAIGIAYVDALARVDRAPHQQGLGAAAVTVRGAARDVSALPSDLQLEAEVGPRLGDAGRPQGRLELAQSFALSSLGGARANAASARAGAYDAERSANRLARRLEASDAWLEAYRAQRALRIARAESELAREIEARAARALALGELTRADTADAEAYAAEAELAVLAVEGESVEARLRLTSAVAVADGLLDASGEPPELAALDDAQIASLRRSAEKLPGPILAELTRRAFDAQLRELEAQHASLLRLGVALEHGDPDTWTPMLVAGISLPWNGRSARERAELRASAELLAAERLERSAAARLQIEQTLHELEHTRELLHQLDSALLPAIERGVSARQALFEQGEIPAQDLIVARRASLAQRMRRESVSVAWLGALAAAHELLQMIEEAKR